MVLVEFYFCKLVKGLVSQVMDVSVYHFEVHFTTFFSTDACLFILNV